MIYAIDITTPASTTKLSPQWTSLNMTKGLVYKVHIQFPKGSAGLLGVAMFRGGFQLWPSSRATYFIGDDNIIEFDDVYLIENDPTLLKIKTYNDDDTYEHQVLIRIGLVSANIFMARFLPSYAYKDYLNILKDLEEEQEKRRQEILKDPFPFSL